MNDRFESVLEEIYEEAMRSIEKHGEQTHLPMGTGRETYPLATKPVRPEGWPGYHHGMNQFWKAQTLAEVATLDTKAHSQNEGGDGTVTWWHILREEVFEAAVEDDIDKLREELIQVAAVAVKMIDALRAKKAQQIRERGLTAKDFEMRWDADRTFPFTESEDATIMAYGHHDKTEFVKLVREYDDLCTEHAETHDESDVMHAWAVRTGDKYEDEVDGWWMSWNGVTAETPHAFPITLIQR